MRETEAQQLLLDILNYAQEGKLLEFHLITSWAEFRFYTQRNRSTKVLIRTLRSAADNLFKTYCEDISTGSADFTKLLAFAELQKVIDFYNKDLAVVQQMLDEYDEYLGEGHFWYSLLGGERETWER